MGGNLIGNGKLPPETAGGGCLFFLAPEAIFTGGRVVCLRKSTIFAGVKGAGGRLARLREYDWAAWKKVVMTNYNCNYIFHA